MLNCGEMINKGEMYSDQLYKHNQRPHSVSCITTEDFIPQLPYDLSMIISTNMMSMDIIEHNIINKMDLKWKTNSSSATPSTMSHNMMIIDSRDENDDFPISATFIQGSI